MRRILHILFAFVVIIAVSCSKYNIADTGSENSYIFFEPDMLEITETKADLITEFPATDGTSFGVIGYYGDNAPIFTEYTNNIAEVYRSSGVYKYDKLSPWIGNQHTFYGFYPYTSLLNKVSVGTDNIPYISYTQPATIDGMHDILGTSLSVTAPVNSVQLHFQHLMWAFRLIVKNSQTKEITSAGEVTNPYLKVTEVIFKLQGFPSSVDIKLNDGFTVTTNSSLDQSYTLYSNTTGDQIANAQSKAYGPLLFVPSKGGLKYQVSIKYVTEAGATGTYTYPSTGYKTVSSDFQSGKAYDLTIEKKDDKFFIGMAPGDWTLSQFEHSFE